MNREVYTYPDGTQYEGEWKEGKRHGKGILVRPDGMKYEGEWENDKPSGQGTVTSPDGRKRTGKWKDGKFLGDAQPVTPQDKRNQELEAENRNLKQEVANLKKRLAELEQQTIQDDPFSWEDEEELKPTSVKQPKGKTVRKKSKVWLALAIPLLVLILIVYAATRNGEEPIAEPQEPVAEVEEDLERVLSETEVEVIKNNLAEEFEEEKELTGNEYILHEIEYDINEDQLNITVDYQADPILPKDELISTNEAWAWRIAEATPDISGKNFNVRITAVTKIGDDEFIHWGSTRYTYIDGEYTFREGEGMELFN